MPMPEILEVSNGTDTVSFLNAGSGFVLGSWEPRIAQKKDGGVWKDSGISDGRQLALKRFENVAETFILKITGLDTNTIYNNLRKLRQMLNQAENYWLTGFSYSPVWITVKGKDEPYQRYAMITAWSYESESNPFHPPMGGTVIRPAMDEFELIIERKPFWTNVQPGNDTAITASVIQTWDGRTVGNVNAAQARQPTTAAEVFFTNKNITAQLTDIYEDDGGAFSANLLNAALPHRVLPAIPVVDDAVYYGIETAVGNSGPFANLIHNLTPGVSVDVTVIWEYWTGAAWDSLFVIDNTLFLRTAGVKMTSWEHPADWVAVAVNGVTAWWVRARVSAITGGAPTGATQALRDIYTVNWAYVETLSDQIAGDIPALTRMLIANESNGSSLIVERYSDRIVAGARGYDRGAGFSAYIPLSDTQKLSGQTIAFAGLGGTYASNVQYSPTGRVVQCAPGAGNTTSVSVVLDNTIANDFTGRFHMYLRAINTAAVYSIQITISAFGNIWVTDAVVGNAQIHPEILDFGSVTLPPAGFGNNETVEEIQFLIQVTQSGAAGVNLQLFDLILIPADEWIGSFYGTNTSTGEYGPALLSTNYLDADSVKFPKRQVYSPVRLRASDNLQSQYTNANIGPIILDRERVLRIWFMTMNSSSLNAGVWQAYQDISHTIQLSTVQRYFSAIGKDL